MANINEVEKLASLLILDKSLMLGCKGTSAHISLDYILCSGLEPLQSH